MNSTPAIPLAHIDRPTLHMPRAHALAVIGVIVATVLVVAAAAADSWLRTTTLASIPQVATDPGALFEPPVALSVTVSAAGQTAPWATTDQELRGNIEMWKRMHLADWNAVPASLRDQALGNMLLRYRHLLNDPSAWDAMGALDWDAVPQPIRTVAYRRMIAYWSGFYAVGAEFKLPAGTVAATLEAIVMSESWFDHRARALNRDGTWDLGLAQASAYARERVRQLHARHQLDASLGEADYTNPWRASRFVALWMLLMIDEANGDLDQAVRAYNRGIGDAGDSVGADYLAVVHRRLTRYIRNVGAPASWDFVWRRARALIQEDAAVFARENTSKDIPPVDLHQPGPRQDEPARSEAGVERRSRPQ